MMKKIINYFGSEKKFYIIMIVLILMWIVVMVFFWIQAENVSRDPCGVCAKRMDSEVVCVIQGGGMIRERTYYPNFSIKTTLDGLNENNLLIPQ